MVAEVSDFIEITDTDPNTNKQEEITIGDDRLVWERRFNTPSRKSNRTAFLIFNIRGLTDTESEVKVKINNETIGTITPYPGLSEASKQQIKKHWYTQMIGIPGKVLKDGENEIQIEAVGFPGANNSNKFDDFVIKNVICFFHQNA
ncbi:polysaccharide lyase family protein [Nostoc sp. FACHB-110]|uniref:polysaccharide lyase family protein n=1 Tax=Nostoc sp. FACHB-110 TaxID=2692834 RepID=UPI00168807A5|nr:polysaccharide lyase family protein [Nostoc sp. FACHB-110]MBD2441010.1 hypothetical protein [Nostoc sp. FACHB-110]